MSIYIKNNTILDQNISKLLLETLFPRFRCQLSIFIFARRINSWGRKLTKEKETRHLTLLL